MTGQDNQPDKAAELRRLAEEKARDRAAGEPPDLAALPPEETRRMVHELRVHQIELEMQNEELRRAHAELDAARARYFDLYDLAPVGYLTVSEQGLILEANLTAAGLWGVTRGALAGQPLTRFIFKEDQDTCHLRRKALFETGKPQSCELRMIKPDGATFWAGLGAVAAREADGEIVCRLTMRDITERKMAEAALREGEERLRFTLESCHIGTWDVDLADHSAVRSLEHARIFGYKQLQPIWSREMFLEHVLPEDRAPVGERIQRAIETQSDFSFECRIRRVDGEIRWIWVAGRYRVDAGGKGRHLAGVVQDITERKDHEAEIERLSRLYAAMGQINQAIVRVNSYEELTREVARVAVELGGFKIAWVGRYNPRTREVAPLAWAGEQWNAVRNFRHSLPDTTEHRCLCVPVIRENRACVVNDLSASPQMSDWLTLVEQAGIHAAAVFPVRVRGAVWGVFGVYAGESGVFQDKEIALLEEAAMDIGYAIEHMDNEAQRRQAEKLQLLTTSILAILNEPLTLREAGNAILGLIKQETGLDAVGIRLKDGEDFPYFSDEGFDQEFLLAENSVILRTETGAACRDADGRLCLQCTCGMVLAEKCGPPSDHVTAAGSIWTNDSLALLESLHGQDPRLKPRNRCVHEGFLSVALIPIRVDQQLIGLLHLNDRRKDRFTPEMIRFFEGLSASFGIAVKRKQAEDALRDSEEKYRRIIETANEGIWSMDGQFRTTYVNQHMADMLGYQIEEMLGKHVDSFIFPENIADHSNKMSMRQSGIGGSYERRFVSKNGSAVWTMVSATALMNEQGAFAGSFGMFTDITDRKRAEDALLRSKAHLRTLVDTLPDLVWLKDPQGVYLSCNSRFESFLGAPEAEVVGKTDYDFFDRQLADFFRANDAAAVAAGSPRVNEEEVTFASDGHRELLETIKTPMFDADGRLIGVLGIARDITQRKKVEMALHESDARYRDLFENMSSGVAVYEAIDDGRDFVFKDFNAAGERIDHDDRHRLIGRSVVAVRPDIEQFGLLDVLRRVWRTGKPEHHPVSQYKDSRLTGWYDNYIYKLSSGEIVAIFDNITDRKQAEESLRESEARFRLLIEGAPEAIFVQCGGTFQYVNRAMAELVGAARVEDLLGRPFLDCVGSELHEVIRERIRTQRDAGAVAPPMEQEYLRLDGSRVPVETTAVAIRFQGQDGHLVFVRDITMRREEEKERANLEAQLRQAQKMESVGRLAGGVAHDFNNMLGIILGHTDMLLEQMDPADPFYADLREIRTAGERSADLTRQLLAFARKQTVAPKVIDLNKTLAGMATMLRRLIGEDIDMEWIPGEKVWPVKIDPGQIDQMLVNLCINARDAIAGVGKVTVETGNRVFDQAYCMGHAGLAPGEYVMLAVSDNGRGMDSETMSHLFEPFFTTKELGKGTGLGLATVYGVVEQNNGHIHVNSEPGRGTTFKIYLPRHLAKTVSSPEKGADKPGGHGHETVLLVEDEPAILNMTKRMLEQEGYTVVAAATPGEAICLANQHAGDIHLLVSDVVMPEMNGRDLAKNILTLYPHLKCLFMSGYTRNVIVHRGVIDEGVNFIEKPFSKGDLAVKVREVLDRD